MKKNLGSGGKQHLYDYKLFGDIYILFNFKQDVEFDLKKVISFIETNVPKVLFKNVDAIYVSSFSKLKNRGMDGLENKGAIYISDEFTSEKDLLKKILHEATHAFVGNNVPELVEREFLTKKTILVNKIKSVFNVDIAGLDDEKYQEFLSNNIQAINLSIRDLFVSAYASVNVKEYIASGVEAYFQESLTWLKDKCPKLFYFIENIILENMESTYE